MAALQKNRAVRISVRIRRLRASLYVRRTRHRSGTVGPSGKRVRLWFNDSGDCTSSTHAAWQDLTGWYWGPMLVEYEESTRIQDPDGALER